MQPVFEAVAEGTEAFRILDPGSDPDRDAVVGVGLIQPRSDGACEVTHTMGCLSDEINTRIGIHAHSRGYRFMDFKVSKGVRASRWAERVNGDEKFDYYRVDLDRAIEHYMTDRAI